MEPVTMAAIMAISAGISMYSQQQQMKAARKARQKAMQDAAQNQNKLVEETYSRKRQLDVGSGGGTLLGGSPIQDPQSQLLSNMNNKKSILAGE